jgi:molecular chaperone DnaJ
MLDAANADERGAEWFYLKGVLYNERGWFHEAAAHFKEASEREPGSSEYKDAFNSMMNKTKGFYSQSGGYNSSRRGGDSCTGCGTGCDICVGCMCADMLCSCCNCC